MTELKDYFTEGMTPEDYRKLLDEQADLHNLHFRRADTGSVSQETVRALNPHHILVITEPWCGDSLAVLPVILKLFQDVGESIVRIVRRDETPVLMDRYLTRGGRAIPIFIFLDGGFVERFHWGPRPEAAQRIFERHREEIRTQLIAKEGVHRRIRTFYGRDRGRSICHEIVRRFRTVK